MNESVYIRPMVPEDALVSYKWRNNPKIWRLTGSRPDKYITPEIEREWIEKILKKEDQKRFSICLSSDDRYIGNVFLTNIKDRTAMMHVFIGEIDFWGSGRALSAIKQLIDYSFNEMDLDKIMAEINQNNIPSISLAKAAGFRQTRSYFHETYRTNFVEVEFLREMYAERKKYKYI